MKRNMFAAASSLAVAFLMLALWSPVANAASLGVSVNDELWRSDIDTAFNQFLSNGNIDPSQDLVALPNGTMALATGNKIWHQTRTGTAAPTNLGNALNPITDLVALSNNKIAAATTNGDLWLADQTNPGFLLFLGNALSATITDMEVRTDDTIVLGTSTGAIFSATDSFNSMSFSGGGLPTVNDIELLPSGDLAIADAAGAVWEYTLGTGNTFNNRGGFLGTIADLVVDSAGVTVVANSIGDVWSQTGVGSGSLFLGNINSVLGTPVDSVGAIELELLANGQVAIGSSNGAVLLATPNSFASLTFNGGGLGTITDMEALPNGDIAIAADGTLWTQTPGVVGVSNAIGGFTGTIHDIEVLADILGDMDGNGLFDVDDIDDFELALSDPVTYTSLTGLDPDIVGDMDGSGALDINDVDNFITVLNGLPNPGPGADSVSAVPEPSSLVIAALGLASLIGFGWRKRQS